MTLKKGDVVAFLRRTVRAGDVVIDVGAGREAAETIVMAKAVGPAGHVYAVEADAIAIVELARRTAPYPQVHIRQAAIGTGSTPATLFRQGDTDQTTRWPGLLRKPEKPSESFTVPMMPLDAVTDQVVHVVKVDVQGGDVDVLASGSRVLSHCRACVVECWPYALDVAGTSAKDLVSLLRHRGLQVETLVGEVLDDAVFDAWIRQASPKTFINLVGMRRSWTM